MRIDCEGLSVVYGTKRALNVDEFTVKKGCLFGLIGFNGSGKSTLLRVVSGIEAPACGHVLYDGERFCEKVRRGMTLLFQSPYMLNTSVANNVGYPLKLRNVSKKEIAVKVSSALEELGISELADRSARSLSGGEAQKVALARAIVFQPSLLLLDEPTANIDPVSMRAMEDCVSRVNARGSTVIIVTHNIAQAGRLCDEVAVMDRGEICECGSVKEVVQAPKSLAARQLIDEISVKQSLWGFENGTIQS